MELALVELLAASRTPLLTSFFLAATAPGSAAFVLVFLPGLALYDRATAALAAAAVLLAGAAELFLNMLVMRPRPAVEQVVVHAPLTSSFPSGHATLAFALAAVLASEHGRRAYFYAVASLVAVSRVYLGVHYPSDVVAGAALGYLGARVVLARREAVLARLPARL